MTTNEQAQEQEIKDSGANDQRITPDRLDEVILSKQFHIFEGTTLTVCALTLQNGFVVTGESAAADSANFNKEIGEKIAYENARNKIWELEGYLLRQKISEQKK